MPPAPPPEPPAWRPLAGLRVLLADDARGARHLYRSALVGAGADVEAVSDGTAAVRAWREAAEAGRPFAAAVLDYVMPGLDGAAVAAALRGEGFRGAVIGISAEIPQAEADRWLKAGCDAVLPKGVSLEGLVARVAAAREPRHQP